MISCLLPFYQKGFLSVRKNSTSFRLSRVHACVKYGEQKGCEIIVTVVLAKDEIGSKMNGNDDISKLQTAWVVYIIYENEDQGLCDHYQIFVDR